MSKVTKLEQVEAIDKLRSILKPGMVVNCILQRVSASGMNRKISLFIVEDGEVRDITFYAGRALGWGLVEVGGHRALNVTGCGMDMGFHTVYSLAWSVFGKVEGADSGYSLKHQWGLADAA